jgi:hypothetical protein
MTGDQSMKNKSAASNVSNKHQQPPLQSEKGLGSKQSSTENISEAQNKKSQIPTSQSSAAVKSKFNK